MHYLAAMGRTGTLLDVFVAPVAGAPMVSVGSARCLAGVGLEGDRYALGTGHYSDRPGRDRQVTLLQVETLEELSRAGLELTALQSRRNLVTRGVDLLGLVGRELWVGEVLLRVCRVSEPCRHLEELTGFSLLEPLLHRGGVNCEIVRGGTVRTGDPVVPVDAAS
jgi:MOSC domain-containing protein YiiM